MKHRYEKLKSLLQELFQLDQPDLDFGFYRIMHARSAEVTQFLDKDLLPQVKAAFAQYQSADKAPIEKELAEVIDGIEAAGMNPEDSPKVKELRAKLTDDAVDLDALEAEACDHLYSLFRRYYSEGNEQDNLVLDEWFTKQGYCSKESEFDLIYVNGDNNLENLKASDDTWKVRLVEKDFFRLMFETGGGV